VDRPSLLLRWAAVFPLSLLTPFRLLPVASAHPEILVQQCGFRPLFLGRNADNKRVVKKHQTNEKENKKKKRTQKGHEEHNIEKKRKNKKKIELEP